MTVRGVARGDGKDEYIENIKKYWLAHGYRVEPYVATIPVTTRRNGGASFYQVVRSNLVNGWPRPENKIDT